MDLLNKRKYHHSLPTQRVLITDNANQTAAQKPRALPQQKQNYNRPKGNARRSKINGKNNKGPVMMMMAGKCHLLLLPSQPMAYFCTSNDNQVTVSNSLCYPKAM